jgi:hypothetical protein
MMPDRCQIFKFPILRRQISDQVNSFMHSYIHKQDIPNTYKPQHPQLPTSLRERLPIND